MVIKSTHAQDGYYYKSGFNLGFIGPNNNHYINNHLQFKLKYHKNANAESIRIVGAEVEPSNRKDCSDINFESVSLDSIENVIIPWTYSVKWEEDPNMEWGFRWDVYTRANPSDKIQWYSLINSSLIVLFLSVQ